MELFNGVIGWNYIVWFQWFKIGIIGWNYEIGIIGWNYEIEIMKLKLQYWLEIGIMKLELFKIDNRGGNY